MEDRFKNGLRGEEYYFLLKAYEHYDDFENKVADEVALYVNDGMKIIELGTGVGTTLEPLMKKVSTKDVKVIAVDIDNNDLNIAKQSITDVKKVQFINADIFHLLPIIESDSFDVVYSAWTLHNFKEDERKFLFDHIKRILKNGGLFVNGDRFAYDDINKQEISIREQLELYKKHLPKKLCDGWSDHIMEDEKWQFKESEQLHYFAGGKFVFRIRNEGIFIAINNK